MRIYLNVLKQARQVSSNSTAMHCAFQVSRQQLRQFGRQPGAQADWAARCTHYWPSQQVVEVPGWPAQSGFGQPLHCADVDLCTLLCMLENLQGHQYKRILFHPVLLAACREAQSITAARHSYLQPCARI